MDKVATEEKRKKEEECSNSRNITLVIDATSNPNEPNDHRSNGQSDCQLFPTFSLFKFFLDFNPYDQTRTVLFKLFKDGSKFEVHVK